MERRSRLAQLVRCVRWEDVILLQGAPVLGVVFSISSMTAITASLPAPFLVFVLGSVLLMIHVFTLNDWAEYTSGVHHSNASMMELEGRSITPRLLLIFSLALLVASLFLFFTLSARCGLIAAAIAVLGFCYSHPSINAKSIPVLSTLLHLAGGVIHFLLGYSLFSEIDFRGVLIGLFFGLTFAAGHPIQEARDFDEDRQAGAKTNAIVFGRKASFIAGLIMFSAQYFCLFMLGWTEYLPRFLIFVSMVSFPIHLGWWFLALRDGLTSQGIVKFQARYRTLYVLIGLVTLFFLFIAT